MTTMAIWKGQMLARDLYQKLRRHPSISEARRLIVGQAIGQIEVLFNKLSTCSGAHEANGFRFS